MHDAFMDSLNAKGKEETKIEEIEKEKANVSKAICGSPVLF